MRGRPVSIATRSKLTRTRKHGGVLGTCVLDISRELAAEIVIGGTQRKDFLQIPNQGKHYELPHVFLLEVASAGVITSITAYSGPCELLSSAWKNDHRRLTTFIQEWRKGSPAKCEQTVPRHTRRRATTAVWRFVVAVRSGGPPDGCSHTGEQLDHGAVKGGDVIGLSG
jgi:hypothetical protein